MDFWFWVIVCVVCKIWIIKAVSKKIKRRCPDKGCGNYSVKRVYFIKLPPEEYELKFPIVCPTSKIPEKIVSWRRPRETLRWFICAKIFKGVPRWFIRRVAIWTFTFCEGSKVAPRRISFAKMEDDPISIWHARWVKRFHPEQYQHMNTEFVLAFADWARHHTHHSDSPNLEPDETDTPDFCLEALVYDFMGKKVGVSETEEGKKE